MKTLGEEINFLKKICIICSFIKSLLLGQMLASFPSPQPLQKPMDTTHPPKLEFKQNRRFYLTLYPQYVLTL